jgi:translation initiation factor 4G
MDEDREEVIEAISLERRKGGDVTPRPPKRPSVKETAPPLEQCEPLQVNQETRWKAKVFEGGGGATEENEEDSDEVVLRKALLILNKLSLTTMDKLSQELVDLGIARNDACLKGVIELIVENAHVQPHFANMYALLCRQLSAWQVGGKKAFKKMLLTQCQVEFEKDTSKAVQEMIAHIEDRQERAYQAALVKKNYLGHMRFIGELYMNDMIKIDIMLWCLNTLLEDDEEQLECFVKLMTTSGGSLSQQALALERAGKPASQEQLQICWKTVQQFAKKGPNNRIKFMLQNLLELRDNGTYRIATRRVLHCGARILIHG